MHVLQLVEILFRNKQMNELSKVGAVFCDAIAEGDADVQAEFLNELLRHLRVRCRGNHDSQLCYIAERLDSNAREMIDSLNQFAKLAVESHSKMEVEIGELYRQRRELEEEVKKLEAERLLVETAAR